MGVGVSGWPLARSASQAGCLGIVSGTGLDVYFTRRLQDGDPDGHLRRAIAQFPCREAAGRILEQYFIPGGKAANQPYRSVTMHSIAPPLHLTELTVLANFAEVWLAKEGHHGQVGINFLEKIQLPTLPSIYGAMLAGADCIVMGAGIPRAIPGILDQLAAGEPVRLPLDVAGALPGEQFFSTLDPHHLLPEPPMLRRPTFLAIVSSATLALALARKSSGRVDGFIVEMASAGGHNAPPRGPMRLSEKGEPIYSERDTPDLAKIKELGLPFWLAGSYGHAGKLAQAIELGAAGIQVGTAFAFCEESGILPTIKHSVIAKSRAGQVSVFTDPYASPTGFPFKVLQLENSLSDPAVYDERPRVCDLGYLRQLFRKTDGSVGYRCSSEPVDLFVRKGGDVTQTPGRRCLCNCLLANLGFGQVRPGYGVEKPMITAGDDATTVVEFTDGVSGTYTAADVIRKLSS